MKKLIIIDGHYFLWRSFSVPFRFFSKTGVPLHTSTMFLKLVRRSVESIKGFSPSDLIVVVFDTDTSNGNFELSQTYKSNRNKFSEGEDSPYLHLPHIRKALDFLNIKYLELPNIEADDVVACIANDFCKKSVKNQSFIVSSDSDFYQILNKQTSILKLGNGKSFEIITPSYVKNKLGVSPEQYVAFKSLTGDSADNIKGIQGIGKITAKKIVNQEIDFDFTKHSEILSLNNKLITLNVKCKKQWDFRKYRFNSKILEISNKDIFERCGF